MVVALGPGKFYGSSLPRPRFFDGPGRVDPPVPVMDPFLSWASEAHWSMGGLSFKRLRLQGRIEGSIKKLRAHHKRSYKLRSVKIRSETDKVRERDVAEWQESDSEPEPEPEPEPVKEAKPRKRARKLADEFEKAADADRVGYQTRSKKAGSSKEMAAGAAESGAKLRRSSPRKFVA